MHEQGQLFPSQPEDEKKMRQEIDALIESHNKRFFSQQGKRELFFSKKQLTQALYGENTRGEFVLLTRCFLKALSSTLQQPHSRELFLTYLLFEIGLKKGEADLPHFRNALLKHARPPKM